MPGGISANVHSATRTKASQKGVMRASLAQSPFPKACFCPQHCRLRLAGDRFASDDYEEEAPDQ